jgi:hypothetical protein
MTRILVELDIHAGLLEVLEIFWHGRTMTQHLDYLGIPFRCSNCHQTGHLWHGFRGALEEEESEGSYLCKLPREDSPGVDSFTSNIDGYMDEEVEEHLDSIELQQSPPSLMGKLKHYFPSM